MCSGDILVMYSGRHPRLTGDVRLRSLAILMANQKRPRSHSHPPGAYEFRPPGHTSRSSLRIILSIAEYEAIRLVDYKELDHSAAADEMEISRPTCVRLVASAHRKIAEALAEGKTIAIEGGASAMRTNRFRCGTCGHLWSETEIIEDPEKLRCPRCNGSRIIDLASIGGNGWQGGRFR